MKKGLMLISVLVIFMLIGFYGVCKLYPCKVSPVIAKPVYTWSMCSMNIFATRNIVGIDERYFGLSYNLGRLVVIFLNLGIAFLIVAGISYVYKKIKK